MDASKDYGLSNWVNYWKEHLGKHRLTHSARHTAKLQKCSFAVITIKRAGNVECGGLGTFSIPNDQKSDLLRHNLYGLPGWCW